MSYDLLLYEIMIKGLNEWLIESNNNLFVKKYKLFILKHFMSVSENIPNKDHDIYKWLVNEFISMDNIEISSDDKDFDIFLKTYNIEADLLNFKGIFRKI